jgi:bacterioferritin (cytochrome b1)
LNEALATEIVCVLRYKHHYFMASGINAQSVAQEFLQHTNDDPTTRRMMEGILAMEEEHADDLVSLLEELGS